MKLPSSSDIKSLLDEAQNLLPNVGNLVKTFNKDIKTKEVLKFSSSFPIVVTTLAMCLKSIIDVMENFNAKNLTSLRNKMGLMIMRDASGKELLDKDGNAVTIMTPFLSVVTSMTSAVDKFNIKSFLKLPMQLNLMKRSFDKIFKALNDILTTNDIFIKSISTNETIKEAIKEKGVLTEKTTTKEGTGGVFKEIAVIFTSMNDIVTMLSNIAKKMPIVSFTTNRILKNRDKIESVFDLLVGITNMFTKEGWIVDNKKLVINAKEIKANIKNWTQFDNLLQGIFNTFLWLGVKSIFILIFYYPIKWSIKLMRSLIIDTKKLFRSLNDPTFVKEMVKASGIILIMGETLLFLTITFLLLAEASIDNFKHIALGFFNIVLFLGATYLVFWLIQKVGAPEIMWQTMASVGLIVLSMLALVELLLLLSYIDGKAIAAGLAGLVGLTTILIAIMGVFSLVKFSVEAIGGKFELLANIGVVILGVLGLSIALWVINMMFEDVSARDIIMDLVILGSVVGMMMSIMWTLGQMSPVSMMKSIAVIAVITLATIGIAYAIKMALEAVHNATLADILLFAGITLRLIGIFVGVGLLASGPQAAIVGIGIALILAISAAVLALGHTIKTIVEAFGKLHEIMSDTSPEEMINELKMIPLLIFAFVGSIMAIPLPVILLAGKKATMLWLAMNPAISTINKMIKTIKNMADGQFEFNDPDNPDKKKTYNLIELFNDGALDRIGDHLTTMILGFANAVASIPWTVALKIMCMEDMMEALDDMIDPISKMVGVVKDIASGTVEVYDSSGNMTKMNLVQFLSSGFDKKITDTMTVLLTGFAKAIASIPWITIKQVENREDFLEELGECVGPVMDLFKMVSDLAKGTVEVDGKKVSLVGFIQSNQGNITNTIKSVIMAFMNAMSMGMGVGKAKDWWGDVFEEYMDAAKDGLEEVPKVLPHLITIIKGVKDIALAIDETKKATDISTISTDTNSILSTILDTVTNPKLTSFEPNGLSKKFSALEEVSVSIANMCRNFNGIESSNNTNFDSTLESSAKFINKVNTISVSKANSLANLFDKLAKLSDSLDGNFDRLADAISDKLINVLSELNETMDDFSGKSTSLGDSIMNIGKGLLNFTPAGIAGNIASSAISSFNNSGSQNSPDNNIKEIKDTINKLLNLASTTGIRTRDGITRYEGLNWSDQNR